MILMTSTIQGELLSIAEQMWIHRRGAADAAAASGWRYFRKLCCVALTTCDAGYDASFFVYSLYHKYPKVWYLQNPTIYLATKIEF